MPTLLHINSSPLYATSISRELSNAWTAQWQASHPGAKVIERDVTATNIPPVSQEFVGAMFTPADAQTPEQKQLLALSDSLVAELEEADEYIIGVPMYNFGVPAALKLWIDQICRVGKTFAYVDGRPKGLLHGKKATFIVASGGIYDADTQMASYDFVAPYLRTLFGFLGVSDVTVHAAGGVSALNHGAVDRETFLAPHMAKVIALATA